MHPSVYIDRYFSIPPGYGPTDALRWSPSGEAIERKDGSTFAVRALAASFLEGFAAQRPLIHFCYVLDLLRLFRMRDEPWYGTSEPLRKILIDAFRTPGSTPRNAGAFFGVICREVPPVYLPEGTSRILASWLASTPSPMTEIKGNSEDPSLDVATFRWFVVDALKGMTEREIRHWFRHGRAPLEGEGERLAEEVINVKPPDFRGTFDELIRQRPRLAGALPFVGTMVSALSLPPRRRAPPELPTGGYADVATRGEPERLLPSQFALDPDDFVRRFAENELLFFRREEPPQRTDEQLILLVDQGVRTWGVVRFALAAAVLAFRKLAERRKLPFFVRFHGPNEERYDPSLADPHLLADRLEVSDLTRNPALLLSAELHEEVSDAADIVLLTHPRSLADADVQNAQRGGSRSQRVFTLAVDEDGAAQFSQIQGGEAVALSRFRLPLHETETASEDWPTDDSSWTGDREPLPFAFAVGPFQKLVALDFDADSEYLLIATQRGYLHLYTIADGKNAEMLPRPFRTGQVMTKVEAVLGMRGGFVVCGIMQNNLAAAYYNLQSRKVQLFILELVQDKIRCWHKFADWNSISWGDSAAGQGLDLATGSLFPDQGQQASDRAKRAYDEAKCRALGAPWISVVPFGESPPTMQSLWVEYSNSLLHVRTPHETFHVRQAEDGRAISLHRKKVYAQYAGGVLALAVEEDPQQLIWRFYHLQEPVAFLEKVEGKASDREFCRLSPDGSSFAIPTRGMQVMVRTLGEGGRNRLVVERGRVHNNAKILLGKASLTIVIGKKRHFISWEQGPLQHRFTKQASDETLSDEVVVGSRRETPSIASYDPSRFGWSASFDVNAIVDATGQVLIHDRHRNRLVCIFFVFQEHLAVWMPDGTRFGWARLTGEPAAPDAALRIAEALRRACTPAGS